MGYKVWVDVGEAKPSTNDLVFRTKGEAEAYGQDLWGRWTSVKKFEIKRTKKPVNYTLNNDVGLKEVAR